ncbi:MAG: DMT family transporter [Candidatus Thorarchaeota archaeon]|jgi:drug/metabolite transporter (DMT)-like permease
MMQIILTAVLIGIVLAIITSLFWNIAPVIQKEALEGMEKIEAAEATKHTRKLFSNKKWVLGFCLSVGGGLTYLLATQMAGIVVVQPLMNVGLIALVILSSRRLGEAIDTQAIIGIILLILTPVFIAFGGVTEPIMFADYLYLLVFCAALLIGIGIMIPASRSIPILWAPITSFLQALASLFTQWFTLALFAGADIIQGFINGLIPLILMGVFTFAAGVYAVSIGLQKNPAARFNAIVGTVSMFAVIFGGTLIFSQVMTNIWFYGIGLAFGVIGVILLSKYQEATEAITEPEDIIEESEEVREQ